MFIILLDIFLISLLILQLPILHQNQIQHNLQHVNQIQQGEQSTLNMSQQSQEKMQINKFQNVRQEALQRSGHEILQHPRLEALEELQLKTLQQQFQGTFQHPGHVMLQQQQHEAHQYPASQNIPSHCNHPVQSDQTKNMPIQQNYQLFSGPSFLPPHILQHQSVTLRNENICDICGVSSFFASLISLHNHCHEFVDLKRGHYFKCSLCNRSFPTKVLIIEHIVLHDVKPFRCSYCPFKSNYKVDLINHFMNT